jgi:hypothetical protein
VARNILTGSARREDEGSARHLLVPYFVKLNFGRKTFRGQFLSLNHGPIHPKIWKPNLYDTLETIS